MKRVWFTGSEMPWCGDRFEIGSRIEWRTGDRDFKWLESFREPWEAARITDAVDPHADDDAHIRRLNGVVRAIDAAMCRYERRAGDRVMTPVGGSGVLRFVAAVDGWEPEDGGARFAGYAVDVELHGAEQL